MVFDYRGFDTLGEAGVLFTALSSIGALFRDGGKKE
jgi:multisubunit Na+/H+ antiporter MnhB subunit